MLVGVLTLYLLFLPTLLHALLGASLLGRLLITIGLIAPIGFLMGIPFPSGLKWMYQDLKSGRSASNRWMIAWVWAVNGAASVIGSILASLISLSFGFSAASGIGVACYLLAWAATRFKSSA